MNIKLIKKKYYAETVFLMIILSVSCSKKKDDSQKNLVLSAAALASCTSTASGGSSSKTVLVPCDTDLIGSRKGQPGNIQDNMFQSLAVDPLNEKILWAGTETSGVFKSADGGTSWTRLRSGLGCDVSRVSYPQIYDVVIDKNDTKNVYMAVISSPGPLTDLKAAHAGFYRSTDSGLTWTQKVKNFPSTYLNRIFMDPNNSKIIYGAVGGAVQDGVSGQTVNPFYSGALMKSVDSGDTWTQLNLPAAALTNAFLSIFIPVSNSNLIYLSGFLHDTVSGNTAQGLLVSSDGGSNWTNKNPSLSGAGKISYFDVFRGDPNIIYANDDTAKKVFKSTDGGSTWTATSIQSVGPIKIHPTDSSTFITASFTKLIKSTNGGISGTTAADTDPSNTLADPKPQFLDLEYSLTNPNTVYAIAKGYTVWKSTDAGSSFTQVVDFHTLLCR